MTPDERTAELDRLNRMLEASRSMGGGYADRVKAIKAKIAEMEAGDAGS